MKMKPKPTRPQNQELDVWQVYDYLLRENLERQLSDYIDESVPKGRPFFRWCLLHNILEEDRRAAERRRAEEKMHKVFGWLRGFV